MSSIKGPDGRKKRERYFLISEMTKEEAMRRAKAQSDMWDQELEPRRRKTRLAGGLKTNNICAFASNFYLRLMRKNIQLVNGGSEVRFYPLFEVRRVNSETKKIQSKTFAISKLGLDHAFNSALELYRDWHNLSSQEVSELRSRKWGHGESIWRIIKSSEDKGWSLSSKHKKSISERILAHTMQ
ncbi:hypothetical protein AB4571_02850 [Vibrio breoganii]|nr:hypothetical protein [Vibrio breoganii]PML13923.1 hypothetical protein BCT84_12245 [Vibrio breoganii]